MTVRAQDRWTTIELSFERQESAHLPSGSLLPTKGTFSRLTVCSIDKVTVTCR